ncbi:MAG: hypothetical protein IJ449_09505 [Clostridia bacterium]|nr:hypothetical protein [Clostridia bacterium]
MTDRVTVAVIEDDSSIGDVLEILLSRAGYHVLRAYSGTEAECRRYIVSR